MGSYHTPDSLSSGGYPDMDVRDSRALRPYESISTPPITLLLYAIVARCAVGGCITPGVRVLAESAGISPGLVSPALYTLARDGWIRYDGRVIMLLINPDHDADQTDHDEDRFVGDHDADRAFDRSGAIDLARDRFESDMVLTTTRIIDSESVVVSYGGMQGGDHPRDHPIALLLSELLPPPGNGVMPKVLAAQPPWTPQEIRDRYESDKPRIEKPGSKNTWGIFWNALMHGERAPARPDPTAPLDPQSYAGRADIMLGSDLPREDAPESIGDIARRLLPPDASTADWVFVQSRLVRHDSEAGALAALAARKAARR
jgi:DNA-binding transcriptional regulator YhcF (GntR family)